MFYGLELKMMCGGAVLLFNVVIIMAVVINLFSPLIYQWSIWLKAQTDTVVKWMWGTVD